MKQKFSSGHILLISPSFFSYHLLIKNALEEKGFTVDWVDDRAGVGFFGKAILRIFPISFTRFLDRRFIKKFSNFEENKYDDILVIKGEGLSYESLRFLKKRFNRASLGLYLWDGVKNAKNSIRISRFFDVVSTFDSEDSKNNNWHYRPLFCKNIDFKSEEIDFKEYTFDISLVGTLHSDRNKIVQKIIENHSGEYNFFFYLYVQNFILKIYKSFYDGTIFSSKNNFIKYKPIDFDKYKYITNSSKAVLDIEHPDQKGFTMRTIETIISGKKLITTNKNIIFSNLFDPSRVLVIDRFDPKISSEFMSSKFLKINKDLLAYYSIENWINELLELQRRNKKFTSHKP